MAETEIGAISELLASSPRPADLAGRRKRLEVVFGSFSLADGVHAEPADLGGVSAEWTSSSSADPSRVILYLHGGGYVSGSIVSHRSMVSYLGVASYQEISLRRFDLATGHDGRGMVGPHYGLRTGSRKAHALQDNLIPSMSASVAYGFVVMHHGPS
jgi:epsilon-lactone hydrolase